MVRNKSILTKYLVVLHNTWLCMLPGSRRPVVPEGMCTQPQCIHSRWVGIHSPTQHYMSSVRERELRRPSYCYCELAGGHVNTTWRCTTALCICCGIIIKVLSFEGDQSFRIPQWNVKISHACRFFWLTEESSDPVVGRRGHLIFFAAWTVLIEEQAGWCSTVKRLELTLADTRLFRTHTQTHTQAHTGQQQLGFRVPGSVESAAAGGF